LENAPPQDVYIGTGLVILTMVWGSSLDWLSGDSKIG